ncbi:MAG: 23S rRNA (adenine(2503)-C(2))-methyltransferase RlmN, partial [Candidatus Cloacimonetes bacterium]|jgi:23S rRNA (adenine2503-C2)-methyltransferase|nr:23S rRNA (adenine(2503)-C(2))-methyltransferase RlmN [Candidatus Cloacimonadota bacterium]MDD4277147.1 23S rRNA (adenine(2503)-C(2))-methyltransferase RlmN [Candidatus Cloacimonadota bacterium]MDY0324905.1 23S rRNA (adenine(2503)-C(2))-methyltransferase RlmN [Candidatus Cloacimonadaceae bacterium]
VGDLSCKINFIPYNQVPDLPYRSPTEREIDEFLSRAQVLNQAITLRRSRGSNISGACGQLAGT